eukprot:CAMPEP_0185265600 /NCGR_PEP_ID=MMETSP1359-20130426/28119_1 /TAXON_ID=552665 /ORGANISM="Bigelowiella longifila, Strain CCMP242" /LENGTH=235 /DNA_ID=CAMNT_0027854967 /DNA_START=21 /DNA_END=728 /DNA_ORIENTATION=+
MLAWNPSKRADIKRIMSHQSLKQENLDPETVRKLVEELKEIKAKVGEAGAQEGKIDEGSYIFYEKTKHRDGDASEYFFSKMLPDLTQLEFDAQHLQRIFQKKNAEKIDSAFEEAFDGKAPVHNEELSPIKCYTKLAYQDTPFQAMKILLSVLDHCKADVVLELDKAPAMKVSLTLKGKEEDQHLQVQCLMRVYKKSQEEAQESVVEVRNLDYGNSDDFHRFFEVLEAKYFKDDDS